MCDNAVCVLWQRYELGLKDLQKGDLCRFSCFTATKAGAKKTMLIPSRVKLELL